MIGVLIQFFYHSRFFIVIDDIGISHHGKYLKVVYKVMIVEVKYL